uniref:Uncharacterized protein n=1 Tax=Arundo donax TaxID=35708 RepID=A0A0A8Y016_ARUDO
MQGCIHDIFCNRTLELSVVHKITQHICTIKRSVSDEARLI